MRAKKYFTPIFLFCAVLLGAEDEKVRVRIIPFTLDNVRVDEGRLIESLVASYISEIEGVTVYVENDDARDGGADDAESYVLSGRIFLENENHVLRLNLDSPQKEGAKDNAYSYKNAGDMALNIRAIVEDYFPKTIGAAENADENALSVNRHNLTGTWQGDEGIEVIRFAPSGRALAFFSTGASMELSWTIEGKAVIVTQTSPNNYRYYSPLPEAAARKVAEEAAPMEWRLFLFDKGAVLRGSRIAAGVEYDTNNAIKRIIPRKIQKTQWKRAQH
jgi:hypothetical protein